jgi:hypothetical protein
MPTTGISYNPSKVAHQELINKVIEEERREIAEEIKELKRFDPDPIPRPAYLDEQSGTVDETDIPIPVLPEDEFKLSINPPVMREDILPKAVKKRRREHKLQEKLSKQSKDQKKYVHDYLLKFSKKALKEKEEKL